MRADRVGSRQRDNGPVTTRFAVSFLLTAMVRGWAQNPAPPAPAATARVIVGLEQSAAGAAAPLKKAAVSLFFSEPLTARFQTWGDVRLSSIPVDVQSTLVTLPADAGKIVGALT